MELSWIKELDYKDHLNDDYYEIIELIGIDNFLKLLERFKKTNIYFSEKPLLALKKEYIKNNPEVPAKDLARELEVSEKFVYNVRSEEHTDPSQTSLFNN